MQFLELLNDIKAYKLPNVKSVYVLYRTIFFSLEPAITLRLSKEDTLNEVMKVERKELSSPLTSIMGIWPDEKMESERQRDHYWKYLQTRLLHQTNLDKQHQLILLHLI